MTDAPDGGTAAGPRCRALADVTAAFPKLSRIGFPGSRVLRRRRLRAPFRATMR